MAKRRQWRLLSVPAIVLLIFSAYIFGVLLFGPSQPPDYDMRTPALIGVFSFALGVALVAIALLKGKSSQGAQVLQAD